MLKTMSLIIKNLCNIMVNSNNGFKKCAREKNKDIIMIMNKWPCFKLKNNNFNNSTENDDNSYLKIFLKMFLRLTLKPKYLILKILFTYFSHFY